MTDTKLKVKELNESEQKLIIDDFIKYQLSGNPKGMFVETAKNLINEAKAKNTADNEKLQTNEPENQSTNIVASDTNVEESENKQLKVDTEQKTETADSKPENTQRVLTDETKTEKVQQPANQNKTQAKKQVTGRCVYCGGQCVNHICQKCNAKFGV